MRTPEARVIVCGCRDWSDSTKLDRGLFEALILLGWSEGPLGKHVTIVHGACPTGADKLADQWAQLRPTTTIERHPADWDHEGAAAGPLRNQHMASLGAALCVAFWDGKSRGTLDMIRRATAHGIPVHIVPATPTSNAQEKK